MSFIIWCPTGHTPTRRHATYQDAETEARRLAATCPSKTFHVYKEVSVVKAELKISVVTGESLLQSQPTNKPTPKDIRDYKYVGFGGSLLVSHADVREGFCRVDGTAQWRYYAHMDWDCTSCEYMAPRTSELAYMCGRTDPHARHA